jgi:hypothetical protein
MLEEPARLVQGAPAADEEEAQAPLMYCTKMKIGATTAIVCHGGRRPREQLCLCGKPATRLCDWIIAKRGKRIVRCSAPMCDGCSIRPAPEKDLCPTHGAEWNKRASNPDREAAT